MNSKQKKMAITGIILGLLLVGVLVIARIYRNANQDTWTKSAKTSISGQSSDFSSDKTSSASSSSSSDPVGEAEDTLETDNKINSSDKVNAAKSSIKTLFDYIDKTESDNLTPSVNTNSSITAKDMLRSLKVMLKAGYKLDLDSLQLYESANDNVEQFTISLVKSSDNTQIALAGNYVPNTKQVEVASIHGDPTDVLGD